MVETIKTPVIAMNQLWVWCYVLDKNGLPKVARAYYDRKMDIVDDANGAKYDDEPNRHAFD